MLPLMFALLLLVSVTLGNDLEPIEDDTNFVLEDDISAENSVAKTKIVSYNKALMSEEDIKLEERRLKEECDCEIQHLKSAGAFILKFKTSEEKRSKDLKLDDTREASADDDVVGIFHEL